MYHSLSKLKMDKKKTNVAHKAWNLPRLALLWRRPVMDLRLLLIKYLKSLVHSNDRGAFRYGERELSFDDTPIIHVKMHRPSSSIRFRLPHIPCINPQVDFDYDFDSNSDGDDITYYNNNGAITKNSLDDEVEEKDEDCKEMAPCNEEGIDRKAEEFIAKFYEEMKLQRQRSYLQALKYNAMPAQ